MNPGNADNAHLVHIGARVEPELAEAVAQLAREGDRTVSRQIRGYVSLLVSPSAEMWRRGER